MPVLPVIDTDWDLGPAAARSLQAALADRVQLLPLPRPPRFVAGADTSYNRGSNRVTGAVVVWDTLIKRVVETRSAVVDTPLPYVPGLLSFREAPALMPAFAALEHTPDVLVFNGHGIAHPRRFGLASHLGVVFGLPAVGVAQNRLVGKHQNPGPNPGDREALILDGMVVGAVIRTRARCNPIFVTPGHRVTVDDACGVTLGLTLGYKLPVVIRAAHQLCNDVRRAL